MLSRIFLVLVFFTPFNSLFAPTSKKLPQLIFSFFLNFFICSLCLSVFLPPTSQSQMSKLLRFLESLGKRNRKRWSQIWKLLLINGVKLQRKKVCIFMANFALGWFWSVTEDIRLLTWKRIIKHYIEDQIFKTLKKLKKKKI